MAFSKQHYVTLAALVAEGHTKNDTGYFAGPGDVLDWLAGRLADTFADDNPRFYRERFLRACDPTAIEPRGAR